MKRIYNNGKSAPAWFVRVAIIIGLPVILTWTFIETFYTGIKHAARFARNDARGAWSDFKKIWNSAR